MTTTTVKVPTKGLYFDRVDAEGDSHRRSYYLDGQHVMELVALPNPDKPGKWTTAVRFLRREKWCSHGWALDSEAEALGMIDAVAIGMETREAATFLGNLKAGS